jgi:hypothetical protein
MVSYFIIVYQELLFFPLLLSFPFSFFQFLIIGLFFPFPLSFFYSLYFLRFLLYFLMFSSLISLLLFIPFHSFSSLTLFSSTLKHFFIYRTVDSHMNRPKRDYRRKIYVQRTNQIQLRSLIIIQRSPNLNPKLPQLINSHLATSLPPPWLPVATGIGRWWSSTSY